MHLSYKITETEILLVDIYFEFDGVFQMDVAKSLFGSRPHEGYAGKEDYNVSVLFVIIIITCNLIFFTSSLTAHIVRLIKSTTYDFCSCTSEYLIFTKTLVNENYFCRVGPFYP